MKKIVLFLVATSLLSCESHQLNDSFILFSEVQPANVDEITHFPQKYIGEYSFDATHKILVQSKYIILKDIDSLEMTKKELDSIQTAELKGNKVLDKETGKLYDVRFKGDTIFWEMANLDTIFSFDEGEVAKLFKQSIILNKEQENGVQVSCINFKGLKGKYIQLGTKKDYKYLKSKLKTNPTIIKENGDTTNVVLTFSRGDFRRLLREEGWEYESSFFK